MLIKDKIKQYMDEVYGEFDTLQERAENLVTELREFEIKLEKLIDYITEAFEED